MNTKVFNINDLSELDFQKIASSLKSSQIGVIPTDTIYGIVGSALNQQTVEQIYTLRKRTPTKPMIILISSLEDLEKFNIQLDEELRNFLLEIWPNSVSVILTCPESKFEYLHRGTKTLAFRMSNYEFLQKLLPQTGPLVAPSANFEGEPSALTINEAKNYFGDSVDFYVDAGKLESEPSTVVKLAGGQIEIIRQGKFNVNDLSSR